MQQLQALRGRLAEADAGVDQETSARNAELAGSLDGFAQPGDDRGDDAVGVVGPFLVVHHHQVRARGSRGLRRSGVAARPPHVVHDRCAGCERGPSNRCVAGVDADQGSSAELSHHGGDDRDCQRCLGFRVDRRSIAIDGRWAGRFRTDVQDLCAGAHEGARLIHSRGHDLVLTAPGSRQPVARE